MTKITTNIYVYTFDKASKTLTCNTIKTQESEKQFTWKEHILGNHYKNHQLRKTSLNTVKDKEDSLQITMVKNDKLYAVSKLMTYFKDIISEHQSIVDDANASIRSLQESLNS